MHLIVCMSFFEAGWLTRTVVQAGQVALTPFLAGLYLVRPQLLHRFVGYLEETAVHTYTNIVRRGRLEPSIPARTHLLTRAIPRGLTAQVHMTETPGTQLHTAWRDVAAPEVAVKYWRMPEDAMWVDCLKRMLADESHHRDVNHALASMPTEKLFGADNPFVHEHIADYEAGVKRNAERLLKQVRAVRLSRILASPRG
jgi:ubiquinol oxidase